MLNLPSGYLPLMIRCMLHVHLRMSSDLCVFEHVYEICLYVCLQEWRTDVRVNIRVYVCAYACMCVFKCTHMCAWPYVCMDGSLDRLTCVCVFVCILECICAPVCLSACVRRSCVCVFVLKLHVLVRVHEMCTYMYVSFRCPFWNHFGKYFGIILEPF